MSTTAPRGRLVAALVVAVTVLLGTVLAVAAWGGVLGHTSPASARTGPSGISREWQDRGYGPSMMDGSRGYGPGMVRGWGNS
jgi:hypothetical protein